MSLEALIKSRIREHGPMSIAEFMALALTHPDYGYYMRGDPLGAAGDFITSPEISQMFGELIGAWLAAQWQQMGKREAILVELGPGRGTLMNDLLRATKNIPGFHASISVHMVEASPSLRAIQQEKLRSAHSSITWHTNIDTLPKFPLLLVANEFFDALPIRQFIHDGEWKERMISVDEHDQLQFVLPAKAGMTIEMCEEAQFIINIIASHIATHGGAALIIDYGYEGGSRGDTLQAMKHHSYHHILDEPGSADLTAHVDFDVLSKRAIAAGAQSYGPITQGTFLERLGIEIRHEILLSKANEAQKSAMISAYERLISPKQMGELFKVLAIVSKNLPRPEGF